MKGKRGFRQEDKKNKEKDEYLEDKNTVELTSNRRRIDGLMNRTHPHMHVAKQLQQIGKKVTSWSVGTNESIVVCVPIS